MDKPTLALSILLSAVRKRKVVRMLLEEEECLRTTKLCFYFFEVWCCFLATFLFL